MKTMEGAIRGIKAIQAKQDRIPQPQPRLSVVENDVATLVTVIIMYFCFIRLIQANFS